MRRAGRVISAVVLAGMFVATAHGADLTVSVNEGETHQTITGLGGQHVGTWKVKVGPFYEDVDLDAIHLYDTLVQDLGVSLVRYFINLNTQTDPQTFTFTDESRRNIGYWLKLKAAASTRCSCGIHR